MGRQEAGAYGSPLELPCNSKRSSIFLLQGLCKRVRVGWSGTHGGWLLSKLQGWMLLQRSYDGSCTAVQLVFASCSGFPSHLMGKYVQHARPQTTLGYVTEIVSCAIPHLISGVVLFGASFSLA
eukprot:991949-Amphidinium_carterae.1